MAKDIHKEEHIANVYHNSKAAHSNVRVKELTPNSQYCNHCHFWFEPKKES